MRWVATAAASLGLLGGWVRPVFVSRGDDQSHSNNGESLKHEQVINFQAEKVNFESVKASIKKKQNLQLSEIRAFRKAPGCQFSNSLCGNYVIQQLILEVLMNKDPQFYETVVDKHLDDWYHFQSVLCYEAYYETWLDLNEFHRKPLLDLQGLKKIQELNDSSTLPEFIPLEDTIQAIDDFRHQTHKRKQSKKRST